MDNRGWQLQIVDLETNNKLDLSSECSCLMKLNEPRQLKIVHIHEELSPEIQINLGNEHLNKSLNGRTLTLIPHTMGKGIISFFIPHNDNLNIIDTVEFMTFEVK